MDNIAIKINGKAFGSINLGANEFFDVLYDSIMSTLKETTE